MLLPMSEVMKQPPVSDGVMLLVQENRDQLGFAGLWHRQYGRGKQRLRVQCKASIHYLFIIHIFA